MHSDETHHPHLRHRPIPESALIKLSIYPPTVHDTDLEQDQGVSNSFTIISNHSASIVPTTLSALCR